jgi:hypothetical protein
MAQQTINIGTAPNDGTGTPLRTSFNYCNLNFTELYTAVGPSGNNIVVPGTATITGNLTARTNGLVVDSNGASFSNATPLSGTDAGLVLGSIGTIRQFTLGLFNVYARIRERDNSNNLSISTNSNDAGTKDDATKSSWKLRIGSGNDNFALQRAPVGSNTFSDLLIIDSAGVATFGDGAGGTRMTLNSTGLGVGVTPSAGRGAIQLSAGIGFPATQVASSDANTLDDYEEGTWSPVITAGSGTPTTVTVNSSTYTKIGRMVVCTFDISVVAVGTASSSLQFGLPFTSITSTAFCGSFREDGSTGNMGMVFYSTGTTAACLLYNNATPWVNGYRLKGTYTYFAA